MLTLIGKRGSAIGVTKTKRIEYAREILQKVREILFFQAFGLYVSQTFINKCSDGDQTCNIA